MVPCKHKQQAGKTADLQLFNNLIATGQLQAQTFIVKGVVKGVVKTTTTHGQIGAFSVMAARQARRHDTTSASATF